MEMSVFQKKIKQTLHMVRLCVLGHVKAVHVFVIDRFCYYEDESDAYVVRPFPSTLKCGVIIPFGLDLLSFDTKRLQGLSRSLEILTYMREGVKKYKLWCGELCLFDLRRLLIICISTPVLTFAASTR